MPADNMGFNSAFKVLIISFSVRVIMVALTLFCCYKIELKRHLVYDSSDSRSFTCFAPA